MHVANSGFFPLVGRGARTWFVLLNLTLGPLVPLSYVWSAKRWPDHVTALWGHLPEVWQLPYTANMFLAAAGYLLFTWHIFRFGHAEQDALGRFGLPGVCMAYLAILIPSTAWMPLTLYAVATTSQLGWLIQLVLAVVAAGSIAVLVSVFTATSKRPTLMWARAGAVFFCAQTVLLDALVWPRFFSIPAW